MTSAPLAAAPPASPLRGAFAELVGADSATGDLYAGYRRLRERAPVHRTAAGFWVLSRYADCVQVLRDDRFGHPQGAAVRTPQALLGGSVEQRHLLLFMNPPEHTAVRTVIREVLSPGRFNRMRQYVHATVAALLRAGLDAGGRLDAIGEFAHPLSLAVVCELLGVPEDDRPPTMAAARDFLAGIDPTFALSEAQARARDEAFAALTDYFTGLIAARRAAPADDVVTALALARDGGAPLTEQQLVGACLLLFIAGHGTTTNLIGNGTLALVRHPAAMARLAAEPNLAGTAVEELLRYDAPSQLTVRTALAGAEIAGNLVRRGEQVVVLRGAANRDPAQFPEPDRLDLTRPDNRHLAFGSGVHRCLGAALARQEGQAALLALVRLGPALAVAPQALRYRDSILIRGLHDLPLTLRRDA
jgi:cytochrome P450